MTYTCQYCTHRTFENKRIYEGHKLFCMFINRSKADKIKQLEKIESPFTDLEKDQLIRNLIYKVEKMEQKMNTMQNELTQLKKKQKVSIVSWLNSENGIVPMYNLREWVLSIPVSEDHLQCVFNNDLTEGMKLCMRDTIDLSGVSHLPICSFVSKSKTNKLMYVHKVPDQHNATENNSPKWVAFQSEDMKRILNLLSFRFLQAYTVWRNERQWITEEEKELEFNYSRKIMAYGMCEHTRFYKLQEWLMNYIQRDFCEIEIV